MGDISRVLCINDDYISYILKPKLLNVIYIVQVIRALRKQTRAFLIRSPKRCASNIIETKARCMTNASEHSAKKKLNIIIEFKNIRKFQLKINETK